MALPLLSLYSLLSFISTYISAWQVSSQACGSRFTVRCLNARPPARAVSEWARSLFLAGPLWALFLVRVMSEFLQLRRRRVGGLLSITKSDSLALSQKQARGAEHGLNEQMGCVLTREKSGLSNFVWYQEISLVVFF
jgi:hypothetical protein